MSIKLRDQVVVITGASSGIGRAAAQLFASRGATVVLAARSRESLEEVAVECERLGARALPVPTDVRSFGAVSDLARRAAMRFGRIDVWVNCAAVMMYERFPEAPMEAFHRVIETNLFGYVHGAAAVLPYFRKQGKGILINIASVLSEAGLPFASAYSASKFAILGFSECLQDELRGHPGIHVCTVLPSTVDTPIFQHAANYTGRATQPIPPLNSPEKAAHAIVRLAERPKRYTIVGVAGRLLLLGVRIAPGLTARAMTALIERRAFLDQPAAPTAGNLFESTPEWNRVSGGFRRRQRQMLLLKLVVRGLTLTLPQSALKLILRGARERVS